MLINKALKVSIYRTFGVGTPSIGHSIEIFFDSIALINV